MWSASGRDVAAENEGGRQRKSKEHTSLGLPELEKEGLIKGPSFVPCIRACATAEAKRKGDFPKLVRPYGNKSHSGSRVRVQVLGLALGSFKCFYSTQNHDPNNWIQLTFLCSKSRRSSLERNGTGWLRDLDFWDPPWDFCYCCSRTPPGDIWSSLPHSEVLKISARTQIPFSIQLRRGRWEGWVLEMLHFKALMEKFHKENHWLPGEEAIFFMEQPCDIQF